MVCLCVYVDFCCECFFTGAFIMLLACFLSSILVVNAGGGDVSDSSKGRAIFL